MVIHLFRYSYLWASQQSGWPAALAIYRATLSHFAVMVAYGMFIPNNWRRALAPVSLIGLAPVALTALLWLRYPGVDTSLTAALSPELLSDVGLLLF